MTKEQKEILKTLHKTLKKLKITIGGCGCCGSPWITFKDGTVLPENNDIRSYLNGRKKDDVE